MKSDVLGIPGAAYLSPRDIPGGALLLLGSSGSAKTMYCRQFLLDGLQAGHFCLFASSLDDKQLEELFSTAGQSLDSLEVVHLSPEGLPGPEWLKALSQQIENIISKAPSSGRPIRVVVDSLSSLIFSAGQEASIQFVSDLVRTLRKVGAISIFTTVSPRSSDYFATHLESLFDGILEVKIEDTSMIRKIRLFSIKGIQHHPIWITFAITENGSLVFGDQASVAGMVCSMCGKPIFGTPISSPDSDHIFDTPECHDTYRKLAGVYGSSVLVSDGLNYEVVNVNLFFIDIVGLSDPSLSVKKQVEKINALTKSIASCDAYKNSRKGKIVLPTGDGMAIGFLQYPELPLQLSIQLHSRLRQYNRGRGKEDEIGVRIGLGSGPVFLVNDINNNQNVWGPGIVLARRVMDIGDDRHILLSGNLADQLIALKDEYKEMIKYIGDYSIKHGQTVRVYSAYSSDFGNPELPRKMNAGS
jgi:KaiC/GvpD/RAD55 family RecA-like ATPase/class 3 adenylate cyclase